MNRKIIPAIILLLAAAVAANAGVEVLPDGVRFTYTDPNASQVSVAGEFNAWNTNATPMTLEDGVWTVTVKLDAGKHEYKYVVDGQWTPDPENPVTFGAYGNSLVEISATGTEVKSEATSNTSFSPKILFGGRFIGLYLTRENASRGRQYELTRPTMDIDLDWRIRANEVTDLHLLTTINNENEETETDFWRTNLRFDRGSIHIKTDELDGYLFDNEGIARWDDPWSLVGGVGIYDHDFGYHQQGAMASTNWKNLKLTLLYADDFENGGTTHPGVDTLSAADDGTVFDSTAFRYGFAASRPITYQAENDDNDRDIMAGRAALPVGSFVLGSSFRFDRGYNPGSLSMIDVDADDVGDTSGVQRYWLSTDEEWWGVGGDIRTGDGDKPYSLAAEFLYGRSDLVARDGFRRDIKLVTNREYSDALQDTVYSTELITTTTDRLLEKAEFRLDKSMRFFLGGTYHFAEKNLDLGFNWARETHDQTIFATGLQDDVENSYNRFDFVVDHSIEKWRNLQITLNAELFDFDYDVKTPWQNQFWFADRNFWLEQGEHEVRYERMTLLGGRDASIIKPVISFDLWRDRDFDFTCRGTLAGEAGKEPKYTETLFQILGHPWKQIRLYSDTRLVKYNDPVLDLFTSYWATFAEVAWEVGKGMEIALSYGVDPIVIDDQVNEYAYIGRDLFLFAGGANGDVARRDYLGLTENISEAEQALEDERRFQIEGIIHF